MTVCAAIKLNNKVWIGADSFLGGDNSKGVLYNSTKINQFSNYAVAITGSLWILNAMESVSSKLEKIKVKDRASASKVATVIFTAAKSIMEAGFIVSIPEDGQSVMLLIATKKSIYLVYSNMSCEECERYASIGAGSAYSDAAIHALYDTEMPGNEILTKALLTACDLSTYCVPPLDVRKL